MRKVLAIVGPTASGKTKVAVEVARRINGEIISADSRQVYKYMNIATAQPDEKDLKKVKHYFINELKPDEEFNAGHFGKKGRELISEIFSRGKQPIVTGGGGLYIRSLVDGFFEDEAGDDKVRNELYGKLEMHGEEYLYDELKNVDEAIYLKIPKGKIRRVIRALEVFYSSGKKMSDLQSVKMEIDFETIQIGLSIERIELYKRIEKRVDAMFDKGLIEEVKELISKGYDYKKNYPVDTVGVKEVFKYLKGEYKYEEMITLIKQNSRRYAKRQMTWFRKDQRIIWIDVNEEDLCGKILNEFERES
ncbi:MAG: tRNA (adenosine(37)-N6)-dimethylallyltransferase MiaA [bacterium]|nr:tRNA (adenosine(37)-N6)-dimethylallyltransferase MiaA [bacterium]